MGHPAPSELGTVVLVTGQSSQDTGVVSTWNAEEGWGALTLDHVDLTVWAHYSAIVAGPADYRSLTPGEQARCRYELPGQDGYLALAVKITKLS
ncbi:cold shock domain-containing protein [Micromonospora sp. WP24]|nr:cold shock domain-containing protein [Micromonospora sp. WP24]